MDDFELRHRHPLIHAMSHDDDVEFLAEIPHEKHPEYVQDLGALVIDQFSDIGIFRKFFLRLVEENSFRKTSVATFLSLNREIPIFEDYQRGEPCQNHSN